MYANWELVELLVLWEMVTPNQPPSQPEIPEFLQSNRNDPPIKAEASSLKKVKLKQCNTDFQSTPTLPELFKTEFSKSDSFEESIQYLLEFIEEKHKAELQAKDNEIEVYREQIKYLREQINELLLIIRESNNGYNKDKKIGIYRECLAETRELFHRFISTHISLQFRAENKSMSETFINNLSGDQIGNLTNKAEGNSRQQANQYNYPPKQRQTLAEAADEIQRLLKQLEQTNPDATEAEQQDYVTASIPPTRRERFLSALQAGWQEAIKAFLDNPYLNVGIATIEGWREVK